MHQLQRQYVNLNNLFIDLKAKGRMATNMLENQKDIHNDVQYQKKTRVSVMKNVTNLLRHNRSQPPEYDCLQMQTGGRMRLCSPECYILTFSVSFRLAMVAPHHETSSHTGEILSYTYLNMFSSNEPIAHYKRVT